MNKAEIRGERHAALTWGAAQAGVAEGVVAAVRDEVIPIGEADQVLLVAAVWVDWEADEEEVVFTNNRNATREALEAGARGLPMVADVLAAGGKSWNPLLSSRAEQMKITDIRLRRLRTQLDPPFHPAWDPEPRRHFEATIVYVETDEGLVGVGSGDTMDGFERFIDLFIGEDPLRIARHVRTLETITFHAGRYWPLEAALWDIIGQTCNVPVSTLFGGSTDQLLAYASWGELKSPGERAESALQLREEGFRALKIRIDRDRSAEGIACVRAVREAVDSSMELIVDLNQGWRMSGDIEPLLDYVSIRGIVEQLRELGVLWVEEPLPASDMMGLKTLRSITGARIAGGEMTRSLPELLAYLDADALDVYQPDVVLAVGMSRARLVAELAHARNHWFTPHTWTNGLGLLANLHVAAGVGGGPYFEFPYDPPGWSVERRDFLLAEPIRITRDGYVEVPNRPGLGAVLDEAAIQRQAVA